MAIDGGPPVAGNMLHNRENPAGTQSLGHRARDRRHLRGTKPVGAVADHLIGTGDRNIGHWQAIDGDTKRRKVGCDQTARQPRGSQSPGPIAVVKASILPAGRVAWPMRWPETLHPTAFLVD